MSSNFFFTDWEGPWAVTDFAYEAAIAFLNSHEFFERLSQYDDYLAYVVKKEDYEAGDTLKLLAPFLVAANVTSRDLEELSSKVASFVPDAKGAMAALKPYNAVVISTAYKQFLEVAARMIGVNGDLWGTEFIPESYDVGEDEKGKVLKAVGVIASLPEIEVKPGMSIDDLDEDSRESVEWLDRFFWNELMKTSFRKVLEEVNAIGGGRKQKIVQSYVERHNIEEIIAIGDSISDHAMLQWVRDKGGIAVSFNGNEFAIKHANVAVISNTAFAEAAVVDLFMKEGVEGVIKFAKNFEKQSLKDSKINPEIVQRLLSSEVKIYWLEDVDVNAVLEESKKMRRLLRGEAGKLG